MRIQTANITGSIFCIWLKQQNRNPISRKSLIGPPNTGIGDFLPVVVDLVAIGQDEPVAQCRIGFVRVAALRNRPAGNPDNLLHWCLENPASPFGREPVVGRKSRDGQSWCKSWVETHENVNAISQSAVRQSRYPHWINPQIDRSHP